MVEDVFADVELIAFTLEAAGISFTYDRADTASACQELLRSQTYDAALSDYHLPGIDGLQVLELLQQSGQDIPLILVTGTLGEEAAVDCIKAGMTDYVLKERLFRLPTVLAKAVQEFELRRAKQAAQAQVLRQAWREAMINRIVQAMRGTLVLNDVLQTTADQLHDVLQVSRCLICQPDGTQQMRMCYISHASGERQQLIGINCDFSEYYREKLARVSQSLSLEVTPT
jgi:CheY-like chemotaxis protein